MRRHIVAGFTVVIGLAGLSGCASVRPAAGSPTPVNLTSAVTDAPSARPSASMPSASAGPETSPPVILNPPGPSPDPNDGVTTLHGQITAGVEPSCKLLTDDKVEYLLLANANTPIPVGVGAIVTGHLAHGIMTHCQQGIPFVVTSIRQVATPQ